VNQTGPGNFSSDDRASTCALLTPAQETDDRLALGALRQELQERRCDFHALESLARLRVRFAQKSFTVSVPASRIVVVSHSSRTLVGSAVVPIGVLKVNPAIPHAALSTTPLSGSFAYYMLLRDSLAEPLFRLLRKLFHGELPKSEVLGLWC
jgi:hypothetical protein